MNKKICAILLASGTGSRMNSKVKKQFMEINSKPLFYYSLKTISEVECIKEIIVVTGKEDINYVNGLIKEFEFDKVHNVIAGGERRQDSVYNALKIIDKTYDFVLIHDSARPLVNGKDIENVIEDGISYGCATLGVKVKDTIKTVDENGFSQNTLNRDELISVQTPQVAKLDILLSGHTEFRDTLFTDDTMVMEKMGVKTKITIGSYSNIKITTSEDLIYLKELM
ncbi:MAG: 2-C-methyl-D-erythritol 4-phosphate cytidylyltransferase [Clostridia bacterium]|nr:2-C-methyl-D-erythritol 4-phosphate cytidylyltransferase [Clostridia bacterium]